MCVGEELGISGETSDPLRPIYPISKTLQASRIIESRPRRL